jgi:hypothetical protein
MMATAPVRRLDASHDPIWGHGFRDIATTSEATQQRLRCRLLVIQGEWFLDTDAGVPWWQPPGSDVKPIMGGPRDLQYAESVLKKIILETDGVATLDRFSMHVDAHRNLTISCSGTTVDGGAFTITDHGP